MEWEPEEQAWLSYIKMELRYKEVESARHIYERFVQVHPDVKNWIRYARFEEQNGYLVNARNVYERASDFFEEQRMDEKLYIAFANFKFEEGNPGIWEDKNHLQICSGSHPKTTSTGTV